MALKIIVVPGLGDRVAARPLRWMARFWKREGIIVRVHVAGWLDGGLLEEKLRRLLMVIDEESAAGNSVALIGMSAGASLALNAFGRRPDVVGMVNVCGRLRAGQGVRPTLDEAALDSGAFRQSVLVCEETQAQLSAERRGRVLVLRPWKDAVVPVETMSLAGAEEHWVWGALHMLSIATAMIGCRAMILRFLSKQANR